MAKGEEGSGGEPTGRGRSIAVREHDEEMVWARSSPRACELEHGVVLGRARGDARGEWLGPGDFEKF